VCVCVCGLFSPLAWKRPEFCVKQPPVMTDTSAGQESELRGGSAHASQAPNWIPVHSYIEP